MSFHILHLLEHDTYLYKKRGRLYCKGKKTTHSLPIENIKAVVVAGRRVAFSSQLISSLLSHDAIILHCDYKYQPIGVTSAISRTINQKLLFGQIRGQAIFVKSCWHQVLRQKVSNQYFALSYLKIEDGLLANRLKDRQLNEGHCARIYFGAYFKYLDQSATNRSQRHKGLLNGSLNYGYAVLNALIHRAILVHGLMPHIGIHHKPRYRSSPLVYDLMEVFRPVVDVLTAIFFKSHINFSEEDSYIRDYSRFIGKNLRDFRVPYKKFTLKLLDATDYYVRSYANACENQSIASFWTPKIDVNDYISNGMIVDD